MNNNQNLSLLEAMSPDVMRKMALKFDKDTILSLCSTSKKIKKEICDSAIFWREKYFRDSKYLQDFNINLVNRAIELESNLKKLINLNKFDYKNVAFKNLNLKFRIEIYQKIYQYLLQYEDDFHIIYNQLKDKNKLNPTNIKKELIYFVKTGDIESDIEKEYRDYLYHISDLLFIKKRVYYELKKVEVTSYIIKNMLEPFTNKYIEFIKKVKSKIEEYEKQNLEGGIVTQYFLTDIRLTSDKFQQKYREEEGEWLWKERMEDLKYGFH